MSTPGERAASPAAIPVPLPAQVELAIRLTYAQMMANAVFGASTGGMFLIGFTIALGADNTRLGLLSTLPQYFVIFQFLAAFLVESGLSRKRITSSFAFLGPLCWLLIAAIPFFGSALSNDARLAVLIGVISLVTLAAQFVGNARGSWIGNLIPAERRGRFFGYCTLFAGIVGSAFAIGEGRFLDFIKSHGLYAFTTLFFFGAVFGLVSAALNLPQPDCPLPGDGRRVRFVAALHETVRNRPFVLLALTHAVVALGGIAGPFNAAYLLRDVGLSFFGLGLLNAVSTLATLIFAPLWGKVVDRVGCRPVLITSLAMLAPCALVWLFIAPGESWRAYHLLPWTNFIAGAGSAGLSVAISTMMYKISRPEGRSIQFAAYGVFVTLVGAPMPLVGGWLVSRLTAAGYAVDLRLTFYAWMFFIICALAVATKVREEKSMGTRAMVFSYFPNRVAQFWDSLISASPFATFLMRFVMPDRDDKNDDPPKTGTP